MGLARTLGARRETPAAVAADQHGAVVAHQHHALISEHGATLQGRLTVSDDRHPAPPGVGRTKRLAAQPEHQRVAVGQAQHAEERSAIGRGQFAKAPPGVIGAQQGAGLAGDVEAPARAAGDGVEVHVLRQQGAPLPAPPAVAGFEEQAIGPHGKAVIFVFKPQVQQRPVFLRRLMHQRPARAAILGAQDHGVVTHGPAVTFIVEMHRGEHGLARRRGYLPGRTLIVRKQNAPALAHGHETFARGCDVEQQLAQERGREGDGLARVRGRRAQQQQEKRCQEPFCRFVKKGS